jgi:Clp amino terminal domain, pathogenicity island component
VGTEHLVLGLIQEPEMAEILETDLESARRALDSMDRDALTAIGIDAELDAPAIPISQRPPKPTLREVLRRRMPLTPAAANAMRTAGRDIRKGRRIPPVRVLLALLEVESPDPATALFAALGVDRTALKQRLCVTSA